jgi:hypothetical protein
MKEMKDFSFDDFLRLGNFLYFYGCRQTLMLFYETAKLNH